MVVGNSLSFSGWDVIQTLLVSISNIPGPRTVGLNRNRPPQTAASLQSKSHVARAQQVNDFALLPRLGRSNTGKIRVLPLKFDPNPKRISLVIGFRKLKRIQSYRSVIATFPRCRLGRNTRARNCNRQPRHENQF